MHEKFSDPARAAYYIGMGLSRDYPDGTVEVTMLAGVRRRQHICATQGVGQVIELLIRRFPRASAYYEPHHPDSQVAEIHCHCEEDLRRTCCRHGSDRPRLLVRLIQSGKVGLVTRSTDATP